MHFQAPRGYAAQQQLLRIGRVMCALLGLAGCASAVPGSGTAQPVVASSPRSDVERDRETEAAILQQINATIGQAPCDTDAQCRTLGLGANACGGPAAWRPWSTQTQDEQGKKLQTLADQLSALQRRRQARAGMVSTCRYLPDPGAVCRAQRCVLKTISDPAS